MKFEEIYSYGDILTYAEEIGYENLTEDDLKKLDDKIDEVCKRAKDEIEKMDLKSIKLRGALLLNESIWANNCYYNLHLKFDNATYERRAARADRIQKALDDANYKASILPENKTLR